MEELKSLAREVDDDGFKVVVHKKKRVRTSLEEDDGEDKVTSLLGQVSSDGGVRKKKKQSKELKNFYRFVISLS